MKKALFRISTALSMTLFCAMNSYSATANNVTTDVYNWQGGTNNYVISLGTTPLKNFSVEFEANAIKDFYIGLYSDTYIREASPTVSIVSNSTQGAGSTKQVLSALVEMLYGCWEKNAYKGFFVERKNKRALSTGYTKLPGAATNYLASSKTDFKKYRYTVVLTGTIFAITLSCLNTKTNAFDEILAFNNTSFNAITTTDTSLPPIAGQKENLITALNKTSFKGFTQIGFVSTTADPYAIKNVAVTAPDSAITKSQIAGYQAQRTAGLAPALVATENNVTNPQTIELRKLALADTANSTSFQNLESFFIKNSKTAEQIASLNVAVALLTVNELAALLLLCDYSTNSLSLPIIQRVSAVDFFNKAKTLKEETQVIRFTKIFMETTDPMVVENQMVYINDNVGKKVFASLSVDKIVNLLNMRFNDQKMLGRIQILASDRFNEVMQKNLSNLALSSETLQIKLNKLEKYFTNFTPTILNELPKMPTTERGKLLLISDSLADKTIFNQIKGTIPENQFYIYLFTKEKNRGEAFSATTSVTEITTLLNTIMGPNFYSGEPCMRLLALVINTYNAPATNNVNVLGRALTLLTPNNAQTCSRVLNNLYFIIGRGYQHLVSPAELAGLTTINTHFNSDCNHATASCPYVSR